MCVFCFFHVGFRPHGSLQASTRIGAQKTHKTQALLSPSGFFSFLVKSHHLPRQALDAAALYRKVDQWRFYIIPQAISQSMRSAAIRPLISRRWRATLSCSCPQMRSGQRNETKRNETKRNTPSLSLLRFLITLSCVLCEDRTNARSTLPR